MNNKKEYKIDFGGKEVVIATGHVARQADGAVLISSGGTQVLVTVCSATETKEGQDFFPLMVEYLERFYSVGKFLGGFLKREAKPSTKETLNARLIDRPLRPLFPEGYMNETVVTCMVISYAPEGDPEILAGLGASAALSISDIPFEKPIGTCKVGRINGEFCINPHNDLWENSDMQIVVSASKDAILMVEGEAFEAQETEILEAVLFAHEHIKSYCTLVETMQKEVGTPKREFIPATPNKELMEKVGAGFSKEARDVLNTDEKIKRQAKTKELENNVAAAMEESPADFGFTEESDFKKESIQSVDKLLYTMMREDILNDEKRIAGRKLDGIRPIETEANCLSTPHGSALFTRGETQVLATVTLGGSKGEQMVDRITGLSYDKFYLHYSFPPFCVGEARGKFNVGRRELGHGHLAERALKAVLPSPEKFSYTIRVACEVLESNGSSSMGSVCAGSMALMDAGVPLNSPVAGIAMGLVKEGDRYKVLSDILGDEDHLGDMDFKVAGTRNGITAIQMDIKIGGIDRKIIEEALEQARVGRLHILDCMSKTLEKERDDFKEGVPRIESSKIDPDKIGALIGPSGKNIKFLQQEYDVSIECEDDGVIRIIGQDKDKIKQCHEMILLQINGPEIGSVYDARVVSIKEYGTFVDIAPGCSGLVHISEIANERVHDIHDYLSSGDICQVKVMDIDSQGRIKFSAKAVKAIPKKG